MMIRLGEGLSEEVEEIGIIFVTSVKYKVFQNEMTVLKEAGEMIQPLRALAAITDDLTPFPAPTW